MEKDHQEKVNQSLSNYICQNKRNAIFKVLGKYSIFNSFKNDDLVVFLLDKKYNHYDNIKFYCLPFEKINDSVIERQLRERIETIAFIERLCFLSIFFYRTEFFLKNKKNIYNSLSLDKKIDHGLLEKGSLAPISFWLNKLNKSKNNHFSDLISNNDSIKYTHSDKLHKGCLSFVDIKNYCSLGFDPNISFETSKTLGHFYFTYIKRLLDSKVQGNSLYKETIDEIKELESYGIDFNLKDDKGMTPLHYFIMPSSISSNYKYKNSFHGEKNTVASILDHFKNKLPTLEIEEINKQSPALKKVLEKKKKNITYIEYLKKETIFHTNKENYILDSSLFWLVKNNYFSKKNYFAFFKSFFDNKVNKSVDRVSVLSDLSFELKNRNILTQKDILFCFLTYCSEHQSKSGALLLSSLFEKNLFEKIDQKDSENINKIFTSFKKNGMSEECFSILEKNIILTRTENLSNRRKRLSKSL